MFAMRCQGKVYQSDMVYYHPFLGDLIHNMLFVKTHNCPLRRYPFGPVPFPAHIDIDKHPVSISLCFRLSHVIMRP